MKSGTDYLLGQLLSLVFYVMTLIIYNRARKEYVGGKIADAINLIMIFLAILLLADSIDYFLAALLSVGADTTLIIKILFKLLALSVLFFGGLRFFSKRSMRGQTTHDTPMMNGIGAVPPSLADVESAPDDSAGVLDGLPPQPKTKPTLGRYEIIEQIGKGAMGIVYKGRDPKLQRLTAIKTIRFIDDFDEDKVEKVKSHFYHEAEVVAKLSHKNIVKIYDVGEDLDLSYLAMEYLEGDSLAKYCSAEHRMPLSTSLDVIVQVCDALDYAHVHGIIHRDIKPGNIMVLANNEVKVTDFGIARAAGSTKTRTGTIKGTPYYMSPEQARGITLAGTADIFSLGVVFYQLLTGKLPFNGENLATIMYQTANADPVSPDTYNPEIEQPVIDILNRAMAKDPEARYQTAAQMAAALRPLIAELKTNDTGIATNQALSATAGQDGHDVTAVSQDPSTESVTAADRLDFTDLDQVLTIETERKAPDALDKTVVLGAGIQIDGTVADSSDTDEIDTLELSDPLIAGRIGTDQADRSIAPAGTAEMRSYKVVRTIPATLPGSHGDSDPGLNQDVSAVRSGKRTFLRRRSVGYGLVLLVLLGGLGAGYYLLWQSPAAENRFLKATYNRFFQSEADKQKEMVEAQRQLVKKIMQQKLLEKQRQASTLDQKQKELQTQQKEGDEQQAKQKRVVQQTLEEARKKQEVERLAKIEALEKKKREERARIEAENKKERARLAALEAKKKAEADRKAEIERQEQAALRMKDIERVENSIKTGEERRRDKKFVEAKAAYETALQAIMASRFKDDGVLSEYRRKIESTLKEDDIVYGSKGYVLHEGKWVTPEEFDLILYSQGFVKYKGEFRDHKTLKDTVKELTMPLVQKHLTRKYSDQTVHSKNIKFQKMVLIRNNDKLSEYSVYYKWEVWTFKGMHDDICMIDIRYTASADKWSLLKGCE